MRPIVTLLAFLGCFAASTAQAQTNPVVIELYTSQGCSSCPPADAMLHDLAKRDDVIALAMHVDYWDYIGWKDEFASPDNTARQHGYARAAGATTVYTPQMVIGGLDHVVGSRPVEVMELVNTHRSKQSPVAVSMTRSGTNVQISANASRKVNQPYVVQLVRYTPEQTVSIRRGENAGRELSYANIVNSFEVIGRWDGASALSMNAAAAGSDPVVVLIQQPGNGPIVAAAQLR